MIRKRVAWVREILYKDDDITEVLVEVENKCHKAINYNKLTGDVQIGDRVQLNTNAIYLGLGTGGYHFIIHNDCNEERDFSFPEGHIIKLRYTPLQVKCITVEEPQSPYHELIKGKDTIDGARVIIAPLHSMLSPVVHILKHHDERIKISYIMTDSACLPISFSKTVKLLKKQRMIDYTITCGQSFGGDLETVNVYTALTTAKYVCRSDIIIIAPGPGVVGTGTVLGFSGIEGGHLIDCVNTLKGIPIFIPRISFADERERHRGISHQSITVLSKITRSAALIGIPHLEEDKDKLILSQIREYRIDKLHKISYVEENTLEILKSRDVTVRTMGRGMEQDADFFKTVGAAATLALDLRY